MQNESETIILNQYESFYIPKGLGHCVASLKENTEIFLMWNPAFNFD
jgi:dTDP-4-dehydrorhamnose 3,5-epimerase-like enzyme